MRGETRSKVLRSSKLEERRSRPSLRVALRKRPRGENSLRIRERERVVVLLLGMMCLVCLHSQER